MINWKVIVKKIELKEKLMFFLLTKRINTNSVISLNAYKFTKRIEAEKAAEIYKGLCGINELKIIEAPDSADIFEIIKKGKPIPEYKAAQFALIDTANSGNYDFPFLAKIFNNINDATKYAQEHAKSNLRIFKAKEPRTEEERESGAFYFIENGEEIKYFCMD